MNRNKVAVLALSSSLLAAVVPSSAHAVLGCTASDSTVCLTDSYGTNILLHFDKHWRTNDYGSFYGFLEIPADVMGYADPLPCPLKGSFVLDSKEDARYAWFTTYIESGCFCGDGANPAFRVAIVRVDRSKGNGNVTQIDDLSAHALRCDGTTQVLGEGEIGPYPSLVAPFPSTTPDWAGAAPPPT
jgi:hypothetical protein